MSAPVCNPFCPFLACATCGWQGGEDSARQGETPGLTWEIRAMQDIAAEIVKGGDQ